MTLPALLSKVSRRTPRFVTVDGRIVAGNEVTATSSGHNHPQHGRVIPVRRHTNHGGRPPDEVRARPWWERSSERLGDERRAMAKAFPAFTLHHVGGPPIWCGEINTGRGRFAVMIVHRPDHGLPHVVPLHPALFRRGEGRRSRKSPHLYLNGNLCVARQEDWDPKHNDATTVVGWAAHWLAAFTEWRITRRWPCEGVEVDVL